jgi:hypothetical protein
MQEQVEHRSKNIGLRLQRRPMFYSKIGRTFQAARDGFSYLLPS